MTDRANAAMLTSTLTHWGAQVVETDGEEIVAVHGHPIDPDPAVIGGGLAAAMSGRIDKPSVRQSWLTDGPGARPELRGKEPFVEVSWDEALRLVAGELERVRADYGCESIFGGSYGWGSAGRFHGPSSHLYRYLRFFGGYTQAFGTYSASAAEAIVPYVLGYGYHAAIAQQTSWRMIVEHAELVVCFGAMRATNTQVTYGGQGPHHTVDWMQKATGQGVEFLNIGPLRDDHSNALGGRWMPLRPSTDVALMLGLANALVTAGNADEAFLERFCTGWAELRAYITGDSDGEPKTPAWASDITGVPEADIVALANEMSNKRTTINLALSVQRTDHGEQSYWMAIALAAVLGQIGLPGGGVSFPFGAQGNVGAGQRRKRVPGLPQPAHPSGMPHISVSRVVDMLENPGLAHDFNGKTNVYPEARLVYWVGGNPFHHHQDLNRLVKAWERPETIVVHEPFWNAMSKRADIVLPATTPLERNDLGGAEDHLIAMQQAIPRQGDARDDYEILSGLAALTGLEEVYTEGRTADEWVEHLYGQFREANGYAKPFDEFWADGVVRHADMGEMGMSDNVFLAAFRQDPVANPLPTPSGRLELVSETIRSFGYDDCPAHPTWMEPYERLGTPQAEIYGLHLVSNQPSHRLHSQYDHGEPSQATKINGREPARLHPEDAAARGLTAGEVIRLFNDRGACLAGLVIDDAVMPGCIQLSTGAWYDPDEDGMCKHGNPNVLTKDKGTSRLAQGPSAHTCLVEAEAFDGTPPAVTAYDPPEFVADPRS